MLGGLHSSWRHVGSSDIFWIRWPPPLCLSSFQNLVNFDLVIFVCFFSRLKEVDWVEWRIPNIIDGQLSSLDLWPIVTLVGSPKNPWGQWLDVTRVKSCKKMTGASFWSMRSLPFGQLTSRLSPWSYVCLLQLGYHFQFQKPANSLEMWTDVQRGSTSSTSY